MSSPITTRHRLRLGLYLALAAAVVLPAAGIRALLHEVRSPLPLAPTPRYHEALARLPAPGEPPLDLDAVQAPRPFTLRRGQTLASVLAELGLERRDAWEAVEAIREHLDVRRIRAGEDGAAFYDGDRLAGLELSLAGKGRLELARAQGGWTSAWHEAVREVTVRRTAGTLEGFLMNDLEAAGGVPELAYAMSNVLQWDLDFNRDLRRGDRFEVLWEDVRLDGVATEPIVLALVYVNRGERYEAFRYGEDGGYYDAEGQPRRKMFLRSPLPFSRVTSGFSHRRFHPVLKVNRPHYGVDYGAPTGTPVRVTANGTVVSVGWTDGGGKTIKVRHANGYLTAYLHLSRYASGLARGKRVHQEEVIGYVGATGLATGPHLDYRVQKDGRWIDPLKLPNTPADPVPAAELPAFRARLDVLRAGLAGAPDTVPPADA